MRFNFNFLPNKEFDVVGLGLTAIDHLIIMENFPQQNTKSRIKDLIIDGGGQMGSGTVALARLGLKARFLGKAGDDDSGKLTLQLLQKEGIDTRYVKIEKEAYTQIAYIIVDESTGERTIMWRRHPHLTFFDGDFPREAVVSGKILHLDAHEVPFSIQAAKWAKEEGIPILIDAERIKDRTFELLPYGDILIADENFSTLLCPDNNTEETLLVIKEKFNPVFCAITLGEQGCVGLFENEFIYIPAYPVKTVDSTGAGDVYHASFIYGVLQNWEIPEIMRFASAAAALKCTGYGGRNSHTLEQVISFMKKK